MAVPHHKLNKLFLGGLPDNVSQEEISQAFGRFGEIIDLVIIRDKVTRLNRGFGFVTFREATAMQAAFKAVTRVRGVVLEVRVAAPKKVSNVEKTMDVSGVRKVFIGGIPKEVTPQYFREHFERYGTVTDAILIQDRDTGVPRGFGFVSFEDAASVAEVMSDYSNHCLMGKWVDCKVALPRQWEEEGEQQAQAVQQPSKANNRGNLSKNSFYGLEEGPSVCQSVNTKKSTKNGLVNRKPRKREKDRIVPQAARPKDKNSRLSRVVDGDNFLFKISCPKYLYRSIRITELLNKADKIDSNQTYSYFHYASGKLQEVKTSKPVHCKDARITSIKGVPESDAGSSSNQRQQNEKEGQTVRQESKVFSEGKPDSLPFSICDWHDSEANSINISMGERTKRWNDMMTPKSLGNSVLLNNQSRGTPKVGIKDTWRLRNHEGLPDGLKTTGITPKTLVSTDFSGKNAASRVMITMRQSFAEQRDTPRIKNGFSEVQRVIQEELYQDSSDEECFQRKIMSSDSEREEENQINIDTKLPPPHQESEETLLNNEQVSLDYVELKAMVVIPSKNANNIGCAP